jgi:predicted nicotinamide N-methyase
MARFHTFVPCLIHTSWNAAKCFADYLDENPELCNGKSVLELGAGGALPSIISILNGAKRVVCSVLVIEYSLTLARWS